MAKLTALEPINHNGRDYQPGDSLTVNDEKQIAQLVESGAAVVDGTKTRAKKASETAEAAVAAAQAAEEAAKAEADAKAAEGAAAAQASADAASDQQSLG